MRGEFTISFESSLADLTDPCSQDSFDVLTIEIDGKPVKTTAQHDHVLGKILAQILDHQSK